MATTAGNSASMDAIATLRYEVGKTAATRRVRSMEEVDALLSENGVERGAPIYRDSPGHGYWCATPEGKRAQLLLTAVR